MDENILYEEIKKAFAVEKGKILFVQVTSMNLADLVPEILNSVEELGERVGSSCFKNIPFAIFDNLRYPNAVYKFRGRSFFQKEVIASGEIIDFGILSEKPITTEDIKRDFTKLNLMLRDPQAV